MIVTLQITYLTTILMAIFAIGVYAWWRGISTRRTQRLERVLSQRYMRIVTAVMLSNESLPTRFPMIERRGAKEILARVLATVATSVYGPDVAVVGRIAVDNDITPWLLRRTRSSRGFVRARYMSQLSLLPLSSESVAQVACYRNDPNRFVRFYALLIRIANDSSSALRELAEYKGSLTRFEIAEIMALLRRGMLPVACEPLLASTNRNLRIVGLNIAREFGIEEVKPLLLDIVASDSDDGVVQEALYTLVSLHSSLAHREIAERVRALVDAERRSLCRRLAYEGYSLSALTPLFESGERGYAEHLVATYKRRIVCMPQF